MISIKGTHSRRAPRTGRGQMQPTSAQHTPAWRFSQLRLVCITFMTSRTLHIHHSTSLPELHWAQCNRNLGVSSSSRRVHFSQLTSSQAEGLFRGLMHTCSRELAFNSAQPASSPCGFVPHLWVPAPFSRWQEGRGQGHGVYQLSVSFSKGSKTF